MRGTPISGEGLSRVYGVTVGADELGLKLEAKIAEIAPRLNLRGFRPGKVPAAHVRRIYGKALMGEVVEQTPAFQPVDVAGLKLERPVYTPTEAEVEEALAELAKQSRTYESREGKA